MQVCDGMWEYSVSPSCFIFNLQQALHRHPSHTSSNHHISAHTCYQHPQPVKANMLTLFPSLCHVDCHTAPGHIIIKGLGCLLHDCLVLHHVSEQCGAVLLLSGSQLAKHLVGNGVVLVDACTCVAVVEGAGWWCCCKQCTNTAPTHLLFDGPAPASPARPTGATCTLSTSRQYHLQPPHHPQAIGRLVGGVC